MSSRGDRSPSREVRDSSRRVRDDFDRSKGESSSHHSTKLLASIKKETRTTSPERPKSRGHHDIHHRSRADDDDHERRRQSSSHAREYDRRREYEDRLERASMARDDEYDRRQLSHHHSSRAREEDLRYSDRRYEAAHHRTGDIAREDRYWRDRAESEDERRRLSRYHDADRHERDRERHSSHLNGRRYRDHEDDRDYYAGKDDRHRHRLYGDSERNRSSRPRSREGRDREADRHKDRDESQASRRSLYDLDKDRHRSRREDDARDSHTREKENGHNRSARHGKEYERHDTDGRERATRDDRLLASHAKLKDGRDAETNGSKRLRRRSTPIEEDVFEKLTSKHKKSVVKTENETKDAERRYANEKKVVAEDEKASNKLNLTLPDELYNQEQKKEGSHQNGAAHSHSKVSDVSKTDTSSSSQNRGQSQSHSQSRPVPRKSLVDRVLSSPTPPPSSRATETSRSAHLSTKEDKESPEIESVAAPLSFTPVVLPHELLEKGHEALIPLRPDGKRLLPYRVTYDPKLDKSGKGKEIIRTSQISSTVQDPRKDRLAKRPARKQVRSFIWAWDQYSTKAKPPPPPSAICISHLSPLITMIQVKQLFRNFGRIEKSELKTDPRTGESLGVAYIEFAQDYDEEGNLKEEARDRGNDQRGDLVASKVIAEQSTIRIGEVKDVKLFLDDEGQTNYVKECRQAMERKYGSSAKGKTTSEGSKANLANRDASSTPATPMQPPPSAPKLLRQQMAATGMSSAAVGLASASRSGFAVSPRAHITMQRPSVAPSVFHHNGYSGNAAHTGEDQYGRRALPYYQGRLLHDQYRPRSSFDASPVVKSPLHSSDDRDVLRDTNTILAELAELGNPYVFVRRIADINSQILGHYYQAFRPIAVYADQSGWYIAFDDPLGAKRSSRLLSEINGVRLSVIWRDRPPKPKASPIVKKHAVKTVWTPAGLTEDASKLIMRQLARDFMREYRSRTQRQFVSSFVKGAGKEALEAGIKADEAEEGRDSDSEGEDVATSTISADRVTDSVEASDHASTSTKETEVSALATDVDEDSPVQVMKKGKKIKKGMKDAIEEEMVDEAMLIDEEIMDVTKPVAVKVKAKVKKKQKTIREKGPALDPFAAGLAEDDEDLYYLKLAMSKLERGLSLADIQSDAMMTLKAMEAENEDGAVGVNDLPRHQSGSARTQGFYRIPPAQKALHLPDRNRAVVDPSSAVGMASARDNRADSRRFVQGIEQHKKDTATDTDILKFNQLRSRKKQLKFAKSPIHDWGLYAMELIPAGDMVIEYVGEIVRQQVADQREKNYERQGNFSTYLFRVDDDVVVDATKKGNIARLMNHCCTPNCNAKILTLNGEKRIVLFAKNTILPGQELTYDYKFQGTGDEEDAIACLCGSLGCRRFL